MATVGVSNFCAGAGTDLPPLPESLLHTAMTSHSAMTSPTALRTSSCSLEGSGRASRLTDLDPALDKLRQEMVDLRRLDRHLLDTLTVLHSSIHEYRKQVADRCNESASECSSFTGLDDDLDLAEEHVYANFPVERVRSVSQLRELHCATPPRDRHARPDHVTSQAGHVTPARDAPPEDLYLEPVSCGRPHAGPCGSPRGHGSHDTPSAGPARACGSRDTPSPGPPYAAVHKQHRSSRRGSCPHKQHKRGSTITNGGSPNGGSPRVNGTPRGAATGNTGIQTGSPTSITGTRAKSATGSPVTNTGSPKPQNGINDVSKSRHQRDYCAVTVPSPRDVTVPSPRDVTVPGSRGLGGRRMSGEYDNLRDMVAQMDLSYESTC